MAGALNENRDVVVDGNLVTFWEPFDSERNGGSLCVTQKKGRWGGFCFGPWESRSRSYWCCISCVGAPEEALFQKLLADAV